MKLVEHEKRHRRSNRLQLKFRKAYTSKRKSEESQLYVCKY